MSQTQQESDRQARLEQHRKLDREKRARETPDVSGWGERERAPTLLMSMEIMYVRASTFDRQTAHARTLFEFC